MHNFTVAIINGRYIFHQQISHYEVVYVGSIKGNFIPAVYIELKMISGRHFCLTYKSMWLLHINKHLQYKNYCIKLNNYLT